jgi:hypothetical protein
MLVCVTEMNTREEIDRLAKALEDVGHDHDSRSRRDPKTANPATG